MLMMLCFTAFSISGSRLRIGSLFCRQPSAIRIEKKGKKGSVVCSGLKLLADGQTLIKDVYMKMLDNNKSELVYPIALSGDVRGNNGVELQIKIENIGLETVVGQVILVEK